MDGVGDKMALLIGGMLKKQYKEFELNNDVQN
jgi:hypothetical protein